MYEYQMIIDRLRQGHSIRSLAKAKFADRKKIREIRAVAQENGWLAEDIKIPDPATLEAVFKCQSISSGRSKAEAHREKIIGWAKQGVQGTTIHAHLVDNHGFQGSYVALQKYIRQVAGMTLEEKMTTPLHFKPGEAAQVDFGKGPDLYDDRVGKVIPTWFFVMTLCWSRHQYAEVVAHQDSETWLKCHQNAFEWFGGVPRKVIIDNAKCAMTKACYNDPAVQRSYEEFALAYGFIISACPPYDPKKKGRVESGVKYVKRSFFPLRETMTLAKTNIALKVWILETASTRTHGSTFEQPIKRFNEIEKKALLPRPKTLPEIAIWKKVSLYRDCHIRYEQCKYSAPYKLYSLPLWIKVTPCCIYIYHDLIRVAMHARRYKAGNSSTDQSHLVPKGQFYLKRDAAWCLKEADEIGPHCHLMVENFLTDPVRDLLRQAQSLLSLKTKYNANRLEKACRRAMAFSTINYEAVKLILKGELDDVPIKEPQDPEPLSDVYQGQGYYQRQINTLH